MVSRVKSAKKRAVADDVPWDEEDDAGLIRALETGLQIDEHALEEGCQRQPDLFYRVAKALAIQISRRDQAKQQLAQAEADADSELRRAASVSDEKTTEKQIASDVARDRDVRAAHTAFLDEQQRVGLLTALKESFQQRSYMLNNLTELYLNGYYANNTGDRTSSKYRSTDAEEAKRRMRELRDRRNDD